MYLTCFCCAPDLSLSCSKCRLGVVHLGSMPSATNPQGADAACALRRPPTGSRQAFCQRPLICETNLRNKVGAVAVISQAALCLRLRSLLLWVGVHPNAPFATLRSAGSHKAASAAELLWPLCLGIRLVCALAAQEAMLHSCVSAWMSAFADCAAAWAVTCPCWLRSDVWEAGTKG